MDKRRVLISTRNRHKTDEIAAICGEFFAFATLTEFPHAPTPEETANTFAGNATIKAVELAHWLASNGIAGIDLVLADDSGLEVDALNGAPGVHSARFAALDSGVAGNSPDGANNAKLLRLLADIPSERRTGRFKCVIALTPVPRNALQSSSPVCYAEEAELETRLFEGTCEGRILSEPKGKSGFGYDPLFVPDGFDVTFAELGEAEKNRISHRSKALAKLKESLR